MNNKMMVRGGVGDITKADLNARPQDNLYLAVNSNGSNTLKFHLIVLESVVLTESI